MKHPDKWRRTVDPFSLPYRKFTLLEVLGYPHAGNDVFHVNGIYAGNRVEAYVKAARQYGANIENEINVLQALDCEQIPSVIDHDGDKKLFAVTSAKQGDRLSAMVGDNFDFASLGYMREYGRMLAELHAVRLNVPSVKDRKFFHIPAREELLAIGSVFVYDYLISEKPQIEHLCFCHGDFHYANILWMDHRISGILDFELSGIGNREFDIAWALCLRPGQRFLKTQKEISEFIEGYCSRGTCDPDLIRYYMILIYAHFYKIGEDDPGYQAYIMQVFMNICK